MRVTADKRQAVSRELLQPVRAVDRFGALHIACNNAGIGGELTSVAELSVKGWQKVIDVNLSGVFYAMRTQLPAMLEAGGGAIVNMASVLGQVGTLSAAAYVSAKHGVVGLTRTAALEYAAKGVRVNAVGPGYIDTPLLESLSSDRASFVTGSHYAVDGGYLAS